MNFRVTIGLAVLLVVLLGAYAVVSRIPQQEQAGQAATPTLIAYGQDDIGEVVVRVGGDRITLRRSEGGEWSYGLGSTPALTSADQTRIQGLVSRLAGLKVQSRIAAEPSPEQVAEYGLQQPQVEVTVNKGAERITLAAGVQNARRTGYYVRQGDDPAVYLVDAFLMDELKGLLTRPPEPPTPTPEPTATPSSTL